jgi:hypothetical protein
VTNYRKLDLSSIIAILNQNLLFKNNKRVGYVTGGALYNQLNLTTQNYFRKKIATNRSRKKIEKGWLKTSTVKSYVDITEENYPLLGILDAIKDIKNIADTSTAKAIKILAPKIGKFEKNDIQSLIEYAFQYPPRVRALLGAILEDKFAAGFTTGGGADGDSTNTLNDFITLACQHHMVWISQGIKKTGTTENDINRLGYFKGLKVQVNSRSATLEEGLTSGDKKTAILFGERISKYILNSK